MNESLFSIASHGKSCVCTEARSSIVIKFYRCTQYGIEREFIHPDCAGDAAIVQQLTGQKVITSAVRELLRDLSRGAISWQEVLQPAKSVSAAQHNTFPGGRW